MKPFVARLQQLIPAAALLSSVPVSGFGAGYTVQEAGDTISIATSAYRLDIHKKGFRFGFTRPDGRSIAPPHSASGLEYGGAWAVATTLRSQGPKSLVLELANQNGLAASVEMEPGEHFVRFSIRTTAEGRMVARTGGVTPAFGLGDHAAFGRSSTDVTGYVDERFRAQESPGHRRLVSNFVICPRQGFATVNMEKGTKIVRITEDEMAQGTLLATQMPSLYYFLGDPEQIYRAYLEARNREGYPVFRPKYEFFGVGWEAFGALGWKTNEKTVTENVERYLELGYPLSWMVVGSGFWPNEDPRLCATTSFGMWDKVRYPEPRRFIQGFRSHGLKFFLGLRISFIEEGPYSAEGVARGYFMGEAGKATAYKLGFPRSPAYLLNGSNPDAVKWYVDLCRKWREYGVDGFKEDLFGYRVANMREGNIDAVNQALMDQGLFIMGRNGYLGSAMDTHRIEDFNFDQNQDRGPINSLAFAYSGFPYVYPDITGGTFGEGRKMPPLNEPRMQRYMMRVAQFDSVHPSMAMGMGPWNFGSAQVEQIMLAAARLHAQLHPYIYSAAIDAHETGFPWTFVPLPLAYPEDPRVYGRENSSIRGYQWLLGPSLLACPLYGNDYATADTRDVYLPAGRWMDYDTGEIHSGPKVLANFALPPGKTPLFVGRNGVLVLRDLEDSSLLAKAYPVAAPGSEYRFVHADGASRSLIKVVAATGKAGAPEVVDTTQKMPVAFRIEPKTAAVVFAIEKNHDYQVRLHPAAEARSEAQAPLPVNHAHAARATASSVLEPRYTPANAVDGVVSDASRWVSGQEPGAKWLELDLGQARKLQCAHVYSGWRDGAAVANLALECWENGKWIAVPGGSVSGNASQSITLNFDHPISAQRVRLVSTDAGPVRLRELAFFEKSAPLGTAIRVAPDHESSTAPAANPFPTNQHPIALNQVGFCTDSPKRFTAPLSPDGSRFELRKVDSETPLFSGVIRGNIGDFTAFRPSDDAPEYRVIISGEGLDQGQSDPFSIRANLWQEQFWQPAVDFMIDARSVVGTHPSAYGGCPWRDGTYYDFIVPSLVELYLADAARVRAMPVQMNWGKDKARVLSPDFKFDANNPHSEGVMEAVRRYYTELEPPQPGAPDVLQLIHWGLGYYLMNPATRDPSGDPVPRQIHSQTVEQFAFFLYAWPQLKQWLPQSFYERCRDFTFAQWKKLGLLEVDALWDAKTYLTPEQLEGPNPTGGPLHPYKGRHAPGHSIQPNLLMYEVARREKREDAGTFMQAAQTQAKWLIAHVDWQDPRTTKGHRMSEHKTIPGLVWFLEHYPQQAPAGLKQKIAEWARVAVERSDNLWDFRRYDLCDHWTIPKLNEPGNLASFTASALAAAWVVDDPAVQRRLRELALAQLDNLFGRNPRLAAAPEYPEQGFPLVERGWPVKFPTNVCARLETTRGALCASPGTEMYPFTPGGKPRHAEGWVNFNAAWNVALAHLKWDALGDRRVQSQRVLE